MSNRNDNVFSPGSTEQENAGMEHATRYYAIRKELTRREVQESAEALILYFNKVGKSDFGIGFRRAAYLLAIGRGEQ
jgi:hypothetical protein